MTATTTRSTFAPAVLGALLTLITLQGCSSKAKSEPPSAQAGSRSQALLVTDLTMDAGVIGNTVSYQATLPVATVVGTVSQTLEASWNASIHNLASAPTVPQGWSLDYYAGATLLGATPTSTAQWNSVTRVTSAGGVTADGVDGERQALLSSIGAPPVVIAASFSGGSAGDGWDVFFDPGHTRVFNVHHHNGPATLMCRYLANSATCPGYPMALSNTPSRATGRVDAASMKVWIPTSNGGYLAWDCADINTGARCATPVVRSTLLQRDTGYDNHADPAIIGRKMYAVGRTPTASVITCLDMSTGTECTGATLPLNGLFNDAGLAAIGTRLYAIPGTNLGIDCYDSATMMRCPGTWPVAAARSPVWAVPNSDGSVTNFCSNANCYAMDGTASTLPPNFRANLAANPVVSLSYTGIQYGKATSFANKASWVIMGNRAACWDLATDTACAPAFPIGVVNMYAPTFDPEDSDCLWTNSDTGIIQNWRVSTGGAGCSGGPPKISFKAAISIPRLGCDPATRVYQYKSFKLVTPAPGQYTSATLTVKNSYGAAVAGWSNIAIPAGTATIDLTTLPNALAGSTPTFEVAANGFTDTSIIPAADFRVTTGATPQMCWSLAGPASSCPATAGIATLNAGSTQITPVSAKGAYTLGGGGGTTNYTDQFSQATVPDTTPYLGNCGGQLQITSKQADSSIAPGVQIFLLDSAGSAVLSGGSPVSATTDATGSASFGVWANVAYKVKMNTMAKYSPASMTVISGGLGATTASGGVVTSNAVTPPLSSSATVFVSVNMLAPAPPVLSAPAAGATVGPTPTASGTCVAGATVDVFEGSTKLCTAACTALAFSCASSPLSTGPHTLFATQSDLHGDSNPSATKTFTVDATPPAAPVISVPVDGAVVAGTTPTISGACETSSTVRVMEGATQRCSVLCSASAFICTSTALTAGSHTFVARQTDAVGNVSGDSAAVTITTSICGNGLLEAGETCDDANASAGDGCSGTCTVEAGFNCTGAVGGLSSCGCTADASCTAAQYCASGTPNTCQTRLGAGTAIPTGHGTCAAGGTLGSAATACTSGLCNGTTDTCAAALGQACTTPDQCATNGCAGGVCVDTVILAVSPGTSQYVGNHPAVTVDPTLTVTGTATITSAVMSLGAGFVAGQDVLGYTTLGTIVGTYDAARGTLTLSGAGTLAQYQAALRSVTFNDSSSTPTPGNRVVSISLGNAQSNPANNHFYEYVSLTSTWTDANAAASTRTYLGLKGYLATITSAAENAFITTKLTSDGWIGAQANPITGFPRTWSWVTGPEAGTAFCTNASAGACSSLSGNYSNWASQEPNDYQGTGEACGQVYFAQGGTWNDLRCTGKALSGYVAEYGGSVGDPVLSISGTRDVNVSFIATALTATGTTLGYAQGAAATVVDPGLSVVGTDTITSATVSLTAGYVAGEDTLAMATTNGISASFGAGTLTLSGSGTTADYQAAFRNVTYANSVTPRPTTALRTVGFAIGAATAQRNLQVKALPLVTVTSSAEPALLSDAVTLTATLLPPASSGTVEFFSDGVSLGTATLSSGVASVSTSTLSPGAHAITATYAGDTQRLAAVGSVSQSITVPPPTIAAPTEAQLFGTATPAINGACTSGTQVTVYEGAAIVCTSACAASAYACTAPLAEGPHSITTSQTASGTESLPSAGTSFLIDLTPPAVAVLTAPVSGSRSNNPTPAVTGHCEPLALVTVYESASARCSALCDAGGAFSCLSSPLAEGAHAFVARQRDPAGNTNGDSDAVSFIVDLTAPLAPTPSAPLANARLLTATPLVSGACEPGALVSVLAGPTLLCTDTCSAGGAFSCTSAALAEGPHVLTAQQTDVAGNPGPASTGLAITIDLTPPAAPALTAPVAGFVTNDTRPTLSGTCEPSATVYVVDVSAFLCSTTCAPEGTFWCASSALAEGVHSLSTNQVDVAGNVGPFSPPRALTIDLTPPELPLVSVPAAGLFTSDTTPTVSGQCETDAVVRVYEGAMELCSATCVAQSFSCDSLTLSDGLHTLVVRQTDPAGNTGADSAPRAFTVDTQVIAPTLTAPVAGAFLSTLTPTLSGACETGATVTAKEGSTELCTATCTASAWSCVSATMSQGEHTAIASQVDHAANASTSVSATFTLDTLVPEAPSIAAPVAGSFLRLRSTAVSGPCETDTHVEVREGTTAICAATCVAGAFTCTTAQLAEELHTFTARQTDRAGNVGPDSAGVTFTFDVTSPAAPQLTTPASGLATTDGQQAPAGSCEAYAVVSVKELGAEICSATCTANGAFFCPTLTFSEGPHGLAVSQVDRAGNPSPTSYSAFTVDTTPPIVPLITEPSAHAVGASATPTLSGTAEGNARVLVSVDGKVVCTTTASADGSWSCQSSALADGPHVAQAITRDALDNTSPASVLVPFVVDTVAPKAPSIALPLNGQSASPWTSFSGRGEAGSTVTVSVDGQEACTSLVDATGAWACMASPSLSAGSHHALASAKDPAGNHSADSNAVDYTVDAHAAPGAPVVQGPKAGDALATPTPTFSGRAEPGATVVVMVDGQPACTAAASATGDFSCTATTSLADGAHTVTATAASGNGKSLPSTPIGFTVDTKVPVAPLLAKPADGSSVGPRPVYSGTAEAGADVAVTVDGGAACHATTDALGRFACAATSALAPGQHTASAVATDAAGHASAASAPITFSVVGGLAPSEPIVGSPLEGAKLSDANVTFSGTAEPGTTVKVSLDGVEVCQATVSPSGDWACTANAVADGSHPVTATASSAAGTSAPSMTGHFALDTTAPLAPAVTSPSTGATTSPWPQYSGAAEAGARVVVKVDGVEVCAATASAAGAFSCSSPVPLPAGSHQVTATATDAAGHDSPASTPHAFTVSLTEPVLLEPAKDAPVKQAMPRFSGTGEPGTTMSVVVDGTVVCTSVVAADGTWSCTSTVALADGRRAVSVSSDDGYGHVKTSPVQYFTVDTVAPGAPAVGSPRAGQQVLGSSIPFTGTGEPGSTVTVKVDGKDACTAVVSADGTWSCSAVGISQGSHQVTTTTVDPAGNVSSTSPEMSFTNLTTLPAPVLRTPEQDASSNGPSVTFSGSATPNTTVTVLDEQGGTVCTATVAANGEWTCTGDMHAGVRTVMVKTEASSVGTGSSEARSFTVLEAVSVGGGGLGCSATDGSPAFLALALAAALMLRRRR